MQRAIATRAPLGQRNAERILSLVAAQLTEGCRLTEHALKGAEEHASLICLAFYIKASLLVHIDVATVSDKVQRVMTKYKDPDSWLDPQQEALEKVCARLEHVHPAEPASRSAWAATATGSSQTPDAAELTCHAWLHSGHPAVCC